MTSEEARRFAEEWVDAWNRHDLDGILAHYAEDIVFTSPFAAKLVPGGDGTVRGRSALRDYFKAGLSAYPDLRFTLRHVAVGVESVTLIYDSVKGLLAAETMTLNRHRKVTRVQCHYA
ncbi:MAG TPA: nuclear transport factor 2 family protein [Planctomycetota bacterium]|jgi:ketosteroid isomerase-like protein|nr:nuclear transport factor 2 family protein [Planctomycetota bacterium]